ncbi:B96 [miniopterid betaherpesvirus 1]|uniref:B96 n=1 Tax=miniopterid betaherpesvirus 1 TaxID=3070189 RepID=I3VQ89_9BETA|nr:B96 [miniopterid betaherpesvirus 1]AFK83933.1 B96 [miniopterid betaherpesvirus 1]
MTSDKDMLKEAMKLKLAQKHQEFVSDKLGEDHPLTAVEQVRVARVASDANLSSTRALSVDLAKLLLRQRAEIKKQTAELRGLSAIGVDEVVDSLTELKDAVEDVKETVLSSLRDICPASED